MRTEDDKSWQRFVSIAANFKLQVDKLHDLMRRVAAITVEKESSGDEFSSMLSEIECLLLDEKQLKESKLLICDSADKLLSKKQVFEYFLTPLFPLEKTTTCQEKEKHQTDQVEEADQEDTL